MRKFLLAAFAAALIVGATQASAQLLGKWAGEGKGFCYPYPDVVIYPWQSWEGEVYYSDETDVPIFEGKWSDELGNQGTFKGKILPISPSEDQRICLGEWTWYDPNSDSSQPTYGGDFRMTFYLEEGYSNGTWSTIWISPSEKGTMKGNKID